MNFRGRQEVNSRTLGSSLLPAHGIPSEVRRDSKETYLLSSWDGLLAKDADSPVPSVALSLRPRAGPGQRIICSSARRTEEGMSAESEGDICNEDRAR